MDAVKLHDNNASIFRKRYDNKDSFKDRLKIWIDLFETYIGKDKTIIELGCGPGLMAKVVLENGNKMIAVDGSAKMIERAKEETQDYKDKIEFVENYITVDFLKQFNENQFDSAISSSVLEYIKEFDLILENSIRIIKPGGYFIFSIPNKQSLFRRIETLSYQLFGKPIYRKLLYSSKTITEIEQLSTSKIQVEKVLFQGNVPYYSALTGFLPERYQKPMMIVVLKKLS